MGALDQRPKLISLVIARETTQDRVNKMRKQIEFSETERERLYGTMRNLIDLDGEFLLSLGGWFLGLGGLSGE